MYVFVYKHQIIMFKIMVMGREPGMTYMLTMTGIYWFQGEIFQNSFFSLGIAVILFRIIISK